MNIISLDTETTGFDFHRGAKPYLVTVTQNIDGDTEPPYYWEWPVCPITRDPDVDQNDIGEIGDLLREADEIVLQNARFDVRAMSKVGIDYWPWDKTRCTLMAGHLLRSNWRHDLTSMVKYYLGRDIAGWDKDLEKACKEARRIVASKKFREEIGEWRIAKKGDPLTPSATQQSWKADGWLPRAVAEVMKYPDDHPWWTVLASYANVDSEFTLELWLVQEEKMEEEGLLGNFFNRLTLLPALYDMEEGGLTLSRRRLRESQKKYQEESDEYGIECLEIAHRNKFDLKLPKTGNNKSLREFCFDVLQLPILKTSQKTGEPSLDAQVMERYEKELPRGSDQQKFVEVIRRKRKRDTAVTYMEGYERFWNSTDDDDTMILYPSLNPTGSSTLRWASRNPNEQNISKQEGFNLRYCFGPAPGRMWASLDYQNLELRIPSFLADEKDAVYVFEHPEEAPYYGSYHLLVFDALHPNIFRKHGAAVKDIYESTLYKYVKFGNFATIYGGQERTVDQAFRVQGGYRIVSKRLPRISELNQKTVEQARRNGYIETIRNRLIDSERGYPLWCPRDEYDEIIPTTPFNYLIQGTAMDIACQAAVKCHRRIRRRKYDCRIVLQVHDEMDFDLPADRDNRDVIDDMAGQMESCGDDVGVPTPVSVTIHRENWSEGEPYKKKPRPIGRGKSS